MTDACTLCGLPTPTPAVDAPDVRGSFCCRGCLQVARAVDDVDGVDASEIATAGTDADTAPSESDTAARATGPPTTGTDAATPGEGLSPNDTGDAAERYLAVEGMHCSMCEAFVALRGESQSGIDDVAASYATDAARVRYDPERIDPEDVPDAVSGYGYRARPRDEADPSPGRDDGTVARLLVGIFLASLVMPWYVFFLYPSYLGFETGILAADRTSAFGLYFPMIVVAVLSGIVVFYTGWPILRGAYVSLRVGRPNMDLLLSVAILSAFAYSTVALATGSVHLYYDVSIAIVLVVTLGGYYEGKLKRRATGLLSDLVTARVTEATRRRADGTTETVHVDDLEPDDEVLVRPGERVPVDGTVVDGVAAVDEAVVTGESLPRTKRPGDTVVGGSVVTDDALVVSVPDDPESTLDRITRLLWAVQSDRPPVQRFVDRLATVFVPFVLLVGAAVTVRRVAGGDPFAAALLAGLTVLVAACPCAMGLATPLAIAGGLRDALERGIVVTTGSLFEDAPTVDTVVFDKTGTLTTGEMTVRSVVGDADAVRAAAAVERRSSHPVGAAIVDHVRAATDGGTVAHDEAAMEGGDGATGRAPHDDGTGASVGPVSNFERHPGEGVSGVVDGEAVVVGTPELVARRCGPLPDGLEDEVSKARADGDLPVVVGHGGRPAAVAVVGDRAREDWGRTLAAFSDREVVVLTGDDASAADRFREHPAVDRVFAGVPPDGKAATVRRLGASGSTAMVGDGTNDAPALAAADVGIALGGTARAAEAADVALVDGTLADVPAVFDLASATRRRIRENVGWALCYNAVAIPLAAAGILNPLFAAVAMAASSVLVVTNSRRRLA